MTAIIGAATIVGDGDVDAAAKTATKEIEHFMASAVKLVREHSLGDVVDPEFYPRMISIYQNQHQVHKSMELNRR